MKKVILIFVTIVLSGLLYAKDNKSTDALLREIDGIIKNFALCIEAGIFMLIAHWWGMTAAITVIAIECVLALWTVYEMRHASDEPVDE